MSERRHFESIGSTNSAAREWARDASTPAPHGAIVSADEQTEGRGRLGRDWVSPRGKGVYLSVVWRPQIQSVQVGQLTIIVALAAARALEKMSELEAHTKWPNDILVNGKKIGGILCEAEFEHERAKFVIAGIGLNVNFGKEELPPRPIFPATSMLLETGHTFEVAAVRENFIESLEREYSRYESGEWNAQRGEFIARCDVLSERVCISGAGQEYSGVAVGIDKNGLLVVQTASGLVNVAVGDVSLTPEKYNIMRFDGKIDLP